MLNYILGMGAPSWLTDQGFAGKLEDVLRGTRPIGREDSALTMTQTLLRMLGTNIYPDPIPKHLPHPQCQEHEAGDR